MSIVLTGGGTAGHVWPHFALFEATNSPLAKAFQEKKINVHYIGSKEGMEKELVTLTQPAWNYHSVATGKLRRYFSIKNFTDPFRILLGFLQAFLLLGKVKAALVFSKGVLSLHQLYGQHGSEVFQLLFMKVTLRQLLLRGSHFLFHLKLSLLFLKLLKKFLLFFKIEFLKWVYLYENHYSQRQKKKV